ncbi:MULTISPECIES: diacylglycerol/lipid kinase family protein [Streptomyces]|uniref:YegS/Rv2252/BmrU family lipid kinase n=1 Tax=Streptomyces solicathayae TaxID=3081768 RepID=A0ABZ0LM98_9ACTN|nr:YegS/Rv2252/BmrU family lipid kinase [Streptomyces sp. HUAS YS2]WOX20512.1 YegS/Rv2252/BmrU family lipid kinase [Streptomyces sp. HUAS YS2]
MRQFTAVVNPTAGGSSGTAGLLPLARLLREAGAQLDTVYSRSLEHAQELAREAGAKGHVVLAVGGDGMAGCVGGALSGTDTVFGLVPAGRGNDFARALGLPTDAARLAETLLEGEPRRVDTIEVESAKHPRISVLGSVYAGVDAVANHHANASRFLRGAASYYAGGLRAVLAWKPAAYRITIDGVLHERSGYTVVAANSGFYGFGRNIAPGASVDDGLLDVVVIQKAPKRLFFAMMNELKTGEHVKRPQIEILRGKEIRIEADRPLPYGADGEVDATLPVTLRVQPSALRVLA